MTELSFFPWMRLVEPVEVEGFRLIPYSRGRDPFGDQPDQQRIIDSVMEPYRQSASRPINSAVLMQRVGAGLLDELDAPARSAAFEFAELIAFAGLAGRRFFLQMDYCSSRDFGLEIVRFSDPSAGIQTQQRRRDLFVTCGWSRSAYQVTRPSGVGGNDHRFLDWNVLRSLLRARSLPSWASIFESIYVFNRANTDGDDATEQTELILTLGGFQRLLDVGSSDVALSDALVGRLRRWVSMPANGAARLSGPRTPAGLLRCGTLCEAWIRDLAHLRDDPAHGRLSSQYPACWSLREHLLLSSYLFPRLMKVVLADAGLYDLLQRDEEDLEAFERLASEGNLFAQREREGEAASIRWNEVMHELALARFQRRWRERLEQERRTDEGRDEGEREQQGEA